MKTYQFLWRLFLYQPWIFLLGQLGIILHTLSRVVFGYTLQAFFNILPQSHQINPAIWLITALILTTAIVRYIIHNTAGLARIHFFFITDSLLRYNLLQRVFMQPGAQALSDSTGEVINRFRDDVTNVSDLFYWLQGAIGLFIFGIVAFIQLLLLNVQLTFLVFVPIAFVVIIVQSMRSRLETYRKASRTATGQISSNIGEIFNAVQAIQVAGAETHVVSHFNRLNNQRRTAMLKDSVFTGALSSVFETVIGLGTGLILILFALSLQGNKLGVGDLTLFIYYLGFVATFTQQTGIILALYTQAGVSIERMHKLFQHEDASVLVQHHPLPPKAALPEISLPSLPEQQRLESLSVSDLTYHYAESSQGIEGINLHLKRGTLTVITGRVASGKTTLVRTLLGLLPKERGNILWNGTPVTDPKTYFVPPRSSYTPQVPHLFSDTLQENILLGLPEADVYKALHTAVLDEDVATMEHGLQTLIGNKGLKLSGGQAQRTAAARMLARPADLLIFDDLSSALDVETEQKLWERLLTSKERTYLVVSHRRAVLQRADHIIVLKNGRIEAEGKLTELLKSSEELQKLMHLL